MILAASPILPAACQHLLRAFPLYAATGIPGAAGR